MTVRHFLEIDQHPPATLEALIDQAIAWKQDGLESHRDLCRGLGFGMLFDKPSTRTRLSFNMAGQQLGFNVLELDSSTMHFSKGKESIADTGRLFNLLLDALMYRTYSTTKIDDFCTTLTIPLLNGLTDWSHPCQVLADVMTVRERFGSLRGRKVVWVGDYTNVARSWLQAAAAFGIDFRLACPAKYSIPDKELADARQAGVQIAVDTDPRKMVEGVDVVSTDVWVSMGNAGDDGQRQVEADDPRQVEANRRRQVLAPYQVNEGLMAEAASDAIFLHCLPAIRGEEVTDGVIDGAQSAVWQQAENRLHIQKAILAWCVGKIDC